MTTKSLHAPDLAPVFDLIRPEAGDLPLATIYERNFGASALCYFGASHTNDPAHPQFEALYGALERFKPDAVIVEGLYEYNTLVDPTRFQRLKNWYLQRSRDEVVRLLNEAGAPIYYAFSNNVFVWCADLSFPRTLEFYVATNGFDINESVAHITALRRRYFRPDDGADWEDLITKDLEQLAKETNRDGQFDKDSVRKAFTRLTGAVLEEIHPRELNNFLAPYTEHPFAKFATAMSRHRDERLLTAIYDLLCKHKKVFVLYGKGHLARTGDALECMAQLFSGETE